MILADAHQKPFVDLPLRRSLLGSLIRLNFRSATLAIVAVVAAFATKVAAEDTTSIRFGNIPTTASGLDFIHADGSSGRHYLIEAVASGLATFDYDLDGDIDIYFLSGAALPGTVYQVPPTNRLYRNDGDWKFTDVTRQAGLGDSGFGLGVAVGDYDNDGWPDVYLNNFGSNALYRNNGDGSFSELEQETLACGTKVGGGASMLDIEGDGDLDIYVANYIRFDFETHPKSVFHGRVVYGGPVLFATEPDNLLRNNGDGTFTDISQSAGISEFSEWGMATIAFDADDDGDTDIFVANDSTMNFLWENDGHGKFTETGLLSGTAYDFNGNPQGSMGVDVADINGDLRLDLFQTAFVNQLATLYENAGDLFFEDATLRTGAGSGTYHHVNWGTGFGDFDNDGDKDLFLANGHIHDNLDEFNDTTKYKIRNQLYENQANGRFTDVSDSCGVGLQVKESSRGVALDDFDGDGRVDIVILNSRGLPTLLRNETQPAGNWIEIQLAGQTCNRGAVGSRVTVQAGGKTQVLEVLSGRGYQSHFGSSLHFGLGNATVVDRLTVHWLGGDTEEILDVPANRAVVVRQGNGLVK